MNKVRVKLNRSIGYEGQYYHPHSKGALVPEKMARDLGLEVIGGQKQTGPKAVKQNKPESEKKPDDNTKTGQAEPDESWNNDDIRAWLDRSDIEYTARDTKAQLLQRITN